MKEINLYGKSESGGIFWAANRWKFGKVFDRVLFEIGGRVFWAGSASHQPGRREIGNEIAGRRGFGEENN
jgi:hypothetical protein